MAPRVMGWMDGFPPDMPSYASEKIRGDVDELLERAGTQKGDVTRGVCW